MSFRDRMRKKRKSISTRHQKVQKKGGSRFPTFFKKEDIPEGIEFFTAKEGEHIVDIIPWEVGKDMPFDENDQPITEEGDLDYVLDLEVHMNVGSMKAPFICPYENFGKPCPICEYIKANRLPKDEWSALRTKRRVLYLVWVHDSREEEKKGLQIFHASHYLMEEKLAEVAKLPRGGGYEEFSDFDNGKSIVWTRKGAGRDTTYIGHKLIDRDRKIPDAILDKAFPLDSIVKMHPTYDEIDSAFHGTSTSESDEASYIEQKEEVEEEKTPRRRRKKKTKTVRTYEPVDVPTDEDYEDYDDDDIPY
jgi:hypothetical protein